MAIGNVLYTQARVFFQTTGRPNSKNEMRHEKIKQVSRVNMERSAADIDKICPHGLAVARAPNFL